MDSTTNIVGWVAEPQGRGTLGLLWSCFATLFLCTWNAIHLNLPGLKESKSKILLNRLAYIGMCLVAPELSALHAIWGLAEARTLQTKTHGWSLKKCWCFAMGGFILEYGPSHDKRRKLLEPKALLKLCEDKSIPWPEVEDADIEDHSKADGLIKLLALLQILWFVAQAIGRAAQGLAMTTIELFTLGIVLWAVIIFLVCWEKPFDIQRPIVIRVYGDEAERAISRLPEAGRVSFLDDLGYATETSNLLGLVLCAFVSLGFSALHIVAWNFYFSSSVELWLWRASCAVCAGAPLLFTLLAWWTKVRNIGDTSFLLITAALMGLYTLGRLYMFVEMLISLRAVPASVYQSPQWSQYLPSFG